MHQCIDYHRARNVYPDNVKMIIRRGRSWIINVIALAVLVSVPFSIAVKLRKPRQWPTTKVPHQSGPVIVRVVHKYSDDELAHTVSTNCTRGNCRRSSIENPDAGSTHSGRRNLPDERYIVYPKKYEHFVSRKNTGHSNRYRRSVELWETRAVNASRPEDTSEAPKHESTKNKLKKVTLYKARKYTQTKEFPKHSSEVSRPKRSARSDYAARRNASDYYAERRAVMERYYARQREINARYGKTGNSSRLYRNDTSRTFPVVNNITPTRFDRELYKNSTTTDKATFHHPSIKIDPIYSNELENSNDILSKPDDRQEIARKTDLGFKSWNSSNIERNSLYNYVTPTPCTNASLSGNFEPKARSKHADNSPKPVESDEIVDHRASFRSTNNKDPGTDHEIWGQCKGKVVYQHNLLLGLKGPSTLDTVFEVIIEGPICITCVEVSRYNETRAKVSLDSGGRGYEFAKFRLRGFQNEGFSYIIKIWGVRKMDPNCNDIN